MPNTNWTDALKEVAAMAPNDEVRLETLQFKHSAADDLFIVQDRKAWNFTLEDASVETFQPVGFEMVLQPPNADGVQELRITVCNIFPDVPDFVEAVGASTTPIEVVYRQYLSSDPTTVQMDPPLTLYLYALEITETRVSGLARFTDLVNARHLTELYTSNRFPGL